MGGVAPLLPKEPPKPKGGRPRVPDRAALTGIIFVLRTGIPWEYLPKEMGCGSGMTCWRRLRDWNKADVWHKLHQVLRMKDGQRKVALSDEQRREIVALRGTVTGLPAEGRYPERGL